MVSTSGSSPFNPGEPPDPWGSLLHGAQDALLVIDDLGICHGLNPAAAALLHLSSLPPSHLCLAQRFPDLETWHRFQSRLLAQDPTPGEMFLAADPPRRIRILATANIRPHRHLLLLQPLPLSERSMESRAQPSTDLGPSPELLPLDQLLDSPTPALTASGILAPLPHWRQVQLALQQSESRFRAIFEQAAVGINQADLSGRFIRANQRFCDLVGYTEAELLQMTYQQLTHPEDRERNQAAIGEMLSGKMASFAQEKRYISRSGEPIWTRVTFSCVRDDQGVISDLAIVEDISERKQIEQELLSQIEREILLNTIVKDIRESLDLNDILNRTVKNIQTVFQGSRGIVALYRDSDAALVHTMAAAAPGLDTTQGLQIPVEGNPHAEAVIAQEEPVAVEDVHQDPLTVSYRSRAEELKIRAMLAVSIRLEDQVKGVLCVHQCQTRHWTADEQRLLRQIADHLALAIQQSELYQQVQAFNADLERQVVARTDQLRQALEFEATLRRITDQVRDGLDEQQILQTVVRDLGQALQGIRCSISFYTSDHQQAVLQCEYLQDKVKAIPDPMVISMPGLADLYGPLLSGRMLQLCSRSLPERLAEAPAPAQPEAVLACPIRDDQEILGDIWISRPARDHFNDLETRLVQQVANQCGIAIRQSRLYQASRQQVQELERLNLLKDDFISTISHELRTPLTNLRLALRLLNQSESPEKQQQYYGMAVTECERQIALITDLLNLQRLTANRYELQWEPLHLLPWLEELIHPYSAVAANQDKTLTFLPSPDLEQAAPFTTDRSSLARVLQELLTNACKYTSPGDQIQISAHLRSGTSGGPRGLQIEVANTGALDPQELARVFEKFYRVPQPDRWKHAGTGLGLALVKRLVEQLQGQINATSQQGWIRFTLWLP